MFRILGLVLALARCWPWSGSQCARLGYPPVVRPGPIPWKPCGPNEEKFKRPTS